jgi:hypothetical protein
MTIALDVSNPEIFQDWWQRRREARAIDLATTEAAIAMGLIVRGDGMLMMTAAGKAHRRLTRPPALSCDCGKKGLSRIAACQRQGCAGRAFAQHRLAG